MAKYTKPVNIWTVWTLPEPSKRMQVGQWVYAGDKNTKGIWCGTRSTGTHVVAWERNIKGRKDPESYIRSLINYAKG